MAKKYLSPLNLLNLTSDPGTAAEGDFYWNSSTNKLRIYFDGAWADASGGAGSGDVVGPASSVTNNIVLFDGTTGKLIKDGGKGLPSGTILGTTDTQTLTNKTLTDSTTYFQDEADNTKKLQFQLSGITTATTRTLTIPDASGTIALGSDIHYIGTTSIALNRSSASQTLTGVSIDGNAGTVTNGVYTTGTYSNPLWITELAWSKISTTPTTLSGYGITDAIDTSAIAQTKSGNLTAAQFIKSGGTSSQFLKADGSVDSSTYLTAPQEIIPLDDLSNRFNGIDTRFIPEYQGVQVTISNPYRLLLTINGIMQYIDSPDYVWMSLLPRRGLFIDSEGYLQFSEAVPAGSDFDARLMPGSETTTRTRVYPFKALDILLGG